MKKTLASRVKRLERQHDRLCDHLNREIGVAQDVPLYARVSSLETGQDDLQTQIDDLTVHILPGGHAEWASGVDSTLAFLDSSVSKLRKTLINVLEREFLSTRVTKWNGKDHKLVPGTREVVPCGDPGCACEECSNRESIDYAVDFALEEKWQDGYKAGEQDKFTEALKARRDELIWATGAWIRPEDNAVIQKRIQELDALIAEAR